MPPTGVPVNYLNGSSKTVISLRTSLRKAEVSTIFPFDDSSVDARRLMGSRAKVEIHLKRDPLSPSLSLSRIVRRDSALGNGRARCDK